MWNHYIVHLRLTQVMLYTIYTGVKKVKLKDFSEREELMVASP